MVYSGAVTITVCCTTLHFKQISDNYSRYQQQWANVGSRAWLMQEIKCFSSLRNGLPSSTAITQHLCNMEVQTTLNMEIYILAFTFKIHNLATNYLCSTVNPHFYSVVYKRHYLERLFKVPDNYTQY